MLIWKLHMPGSVHQYTDQALSKGHSCDRSAPVGLLPLLLVVVLRWPMTHLTGGRSVPCPEESHEWMQLYKILRVLLAHWGHIGFIEPISNVKLEI